MRIDRWAQIAAVVANLAVVASLVLLIDGVQDNTRALERQADHQRAAVYSEPFFIDPGLADVLAKIKDVDGADQIPMGLAEAYGLSNSEAIRWERHLSLLWTGFEADFVAMGETTDLSRSIQSFLCAKDNQIWWEGYRRFARPEFDEYVGRLSPPPGFCQTGAQ